MGVATITEAEMKSAILNSGYLLEQRIETVLKKRGYYVETNAAYPDPFTGKSRELDIDAIKGYKISRDYDLLFSRLLCECENNREPLVFFIKDSPVSFLNYYEVKCAGLPVQFLTKSNVPIKGTRVDSNYEYMGLSDFVHFEKYHHYCKGLISTQYCTFTNNRGKKPWIAYHDDTQHDSLNGLIYDLEANIDSYYKGYSLPKKNETEQVNIEIYYPILIIQGLLFTASIQRGLLSLKKSPHVQFRKEYFSKDKHDTYQIDIVTEEFFPKYLSIVDRELEGAKARLTRNKKLVRESLTSLLYKAVKERKDKKTFREIFEF